jgi:uncharacterized protein (TIGR02996 family)
MTSQHDALYRAICEFPDEDTPRLAFADLLEESGDPLRAEFIRLQVELVRVPEYDPLWVKCRQFHPGVFLGHYMTGTLPKLPAGFSHYRFRRGFSWLAQVLGSDVFTERAQALFAAAPIQAMSFDDRGRPDLAELADCPHLARIHRLDFSVSRFDAEDMARLGHSPHATALTELVFEYDAIRDDGLQALVTSPLFARLEGLKLDKTYLPPALLIDALGAADGSGRLRKLSLPFCDLPPPDAAQLFHLPIMQGLEHLDLEENETLGPEGIEMLTESRLIRGLQVLNLAKTFPGVPGVRALTATGGLAGVRLLDLSANRLGPVAARVLVGSDRVRGLRVLKLANNPIGTRGAEELAGSRHLAGLLELDLRDCDVGDAGATALAESPYLDNLLRLDLRGRRLGDEARAALVDRFGPRASLDDDD